MACYEGRPKRRIKASAILGYHCTASTLVRAQQWNVQHKFLKMQGRIGNSITPLTNALQLLIWQAWLKLILSLAYLQHSIWTVNSNYKHACAAFTQRSYCIQPYIHVISDTNNTTWLQLWHGMQLLVCTAAYHPLCRSRWDIFCMFYLRACLYLLDKAAIWLSWQFW